MKIPLVNLKAQYKSIKKETDSAINRVIENTQFINGEDNELFEKEFADYCDAKYTIGVGSGSMALDFTLEALGINKGDEVICPSHTFAATAEAIAKQGATPVFVDISEGTFNIDPDLIVEKITPKTKAIIAVHLYGQPADMKRIKAIAKKHKLWIIEDAAQAHGALYNGRKVGSLGHAACFSFFPAKNLGCYGDGGAVVTNNKGFARKVGLLKDHGRTGKYEHLKIGYGGRLDNLQAAILRVKLKYLDKWNSKKRTIAKIYSSRLFEKYITPLVPEYAVPAYYIYTLRHPKRNIVVSKLKESGIGVGIYYPIPLHLQRAFRFLGYKRGDLPITEKVCREIFSIPIYPELSEKQINFIINKLLNLAN